MVGEADGEGEEGVGGIGEAGGGEDGGGADEAVVDAVEFEVQVDYAPVGGRGHAHAAHVVVAVSASLAEAVGVVEEVGMG